MTFNHEGSWFKIESDDVNVETVISEDVMSLSIVEEMAKMDTGNLQLLDRNHIYSRILRPGAKLKVSWGTRLGMPGAFSRSPIEVMINSPGGGGASNGQVVYNCSFQDLKSRGGQTTKWYETGTKADVVADALARCGVSSGNWEIDFARGSEGISAGTKVVQNESDFRFLVRCADEWRAAFRIGQDKNGNRIACFVDYSKLSSTGFVEKMTGSSSAHLEYGGGSRDVLTGSANVIEYTWQDRSMDAANGQGVQIYEADGKIQMMTYTVEDESVTTWRLVPELIENEMKQHGLSGQTKLLGEYLSARDFEQIKRFFVKETTTTAPQGSGITIDAKLMGEPAITASMIATFGNGFPSKVGASGKTWWIRKVTHSISNSGYFTDVSISDAYAFSPTGQKL